MQDFSQSGSSPYHFIGIGGIGMSAIAHILVKRGHRVSGSDLQPSRVTDLLADLGVQLYWGQSAQNIAVAERPQVVYSSAIKQDNPELVAAIAHDLPIWHRADLLAQLINYSHSVAVAGTHGKTTTSSLVGFLLIEAGLDPTIVVGGEVSAWGGNARVGNSNYLVAEADESDGSLLKFNPQIGVITNIELDHPDHYRDLAQVVTTFRQFARQCGVVVVSLDCPTAREQITGQITGRITYSLADGGADYWVKDVVYGGDRTSAVLVERGQVLGAFELSLVGAHNLSNGLAAIAVARHLGIEWHKIQRALPLFRGAKRRFEVRAEWQGITLVDDYAHHPSEILATLAAAKLQKRRVVAVFQPHRYSRTQALFAEFMTAFGMADVLILTDIYGAGEVQPVGLSGQKLAAAIVHPQLHYQPCLTDIPILLKKLLRSGDLVLLMGAGNLNQMIAPTLALLQG